MRLPWQKSNEKQLDLLGDELVRGQAGSAGRLKARAAPLSSAGRPCMVPVEQIDEDPTNPRAEFTDADLDDLAEDIRLRGVLVPLVVHPAGTGGRYLLHFGARRLRAAVRAGLLEVPVIFRDLPADRYAQVAENQKRHGLSPIELARFIRTQVDAGDSNATIARQLGMNLTTVSHHLSLLELPPVVDDALKAGRCTSPRTLHELSKLHDRHPARVKGLLDSSVPITRDAVDTLRARVGAISANGSARLIGQAMSACDRLEKMLASIDLHGTSSDRSDLVALRSRLSALSHWSTDGSDRQTP